MKPYKNIKLEEFPDVADIQFEGRKTSVGRIHKEDRDYRGYNSPDKKKKSRRYLKRKDRQLQIKLERRLYNE